MWGDWCRICWPLVGAQTKGGTPSAWPLHQPGGKQAGTGCPSGAFLWGFPPRQLGTHSMWVRAELGPRGRAGQATFISFKSCPLALKLWGLVILAGSSQQDVPLDDSSLKTEGLAQSQKEGVRDASGPPLAPPRGVPQPTGRT